MKNDEKDILLRFGQLTALFEDGSLNAIKLGKNHILKSIYFAVRDANWGTVPHRIENKNLVRTKAGFNFRFECICRQKGIDFRWNCHISGEKNTLTFDISGRAFRAFDANRIGFCILHPIGENVGRPVRLLHPGGVFGEGSFPVEISPHQPFKNLVGMTYETDIAEVRLDFEGDIFETEDQRNWLDDSYKTYCTPLERPFPVTLEVGNQIRQRVTLKVIPKTDKDRTVKRHRPKLRILEKTSPLPRIGLEANTLKLNPWAVEKLSALSLSFLRVELRLDKADWLKDFASKTAQAKKLQLPIELALFARDDLAFLKTALSKIDWKGIQIMNLLLLEVDAQVTGKAFAERIMPVLREEFGNIPIGGGTDYYFTQVNRDRPPMDLLDFCSFSANPQVHAFDDKSILETTVTFGWMIKSVRTFLEGKPIHISPITLRPRSNPDAIRPIPPDEQERMRLDSRHNQLFNAFWTFGAIKHLTESGAAQVTFFQTLGNEGVLDQDRKITFPVYEVFAYLGSNPGTQWVHTQSSRPEDFEVGILEKGSGRFYALTNYTDKRIALKINELPISIGPKELKFIRKE